VCSAVSVESFCSGCVTSISHIISHGTTHRLEQDISCCACARVIFLVRLQRMTILWTAFRLLSTPAHTDQRGKRAVTRAVTHAVTTIYEQQSRVESNPVQSDSQRRGSDSVPYLKWPPRQCVHTSRVESSRVESCRVTGVLSSQESWCRMLHFRQSDSSDRSWLDDDDVHNNKNRTTNNSNKNLIVIKPSI
jgi:hypothetical protein